jgi:putative membrane protein
MMGYYGHYPASGFIFGLGSLFSLFWWVFIGLGIALLVKAFFRSANDHENTEAEHKSKAKDILDERYVKGEITKKEYEQMKKDIRI